MRDTILLTVNLITDDDTGIYQIGELDFGITGMCKKYIEKPKNRTKLADWLQWLANQCRQNKSPFKDEASIQAELDEWTGGQSDA